jgi:hypothetical protein
MGDYFKKRRLLNRLHDEILGVNVDAWTNTGRGGLESPTSWVIGDDPIDVQGLIARFDELPSTNREVWAIWVESGHGAGLDMRIAGDAQKMLNEALVPTAEFSFHSTVLAFHQRFLALDAKVTKQPYNDEKSPYWDEVKNYIVDGSKLANLLEDTAKQTVKWTDVKDAAAKAAQGAGKALDTAKWTSYALIGGAVVLGLGALYAVYKLASSPTGAAFAGGYLGGRR